jgi:hypothetical protein
VPITSQPRKASPGKTVPGALDRLARTFAAQIEALNRYRNHDEPAITVQNVSVGDGGKAIVGNVTRHASVIVSGQERSDRGDGGPDGVDA